MNLTSILLLALAMSTDAFAAAVGKGTALQNPRWSEALRTGLIFGVIEALTPLLGWALGLAAALYIRTWDHLPGWTHLSAAQHSGHENPWTEEARSTVSRRMNHAPTGFLCLSGDASIRSSRPPVAI
jgi:Putative manganese efflux pump